jgi:isoleucyl-tRNA synthetase
MSEAVAFWVDMDHPYVTYENNYIESVWWSLKTIHEKGLLYRGLKSMPYCPRCGTALASHEVAQGYKEVTDASVFVRFRLADDPATAFLAWTTTPWTLPSNLALCVNAREEYATVSWQGERLILAKTLLPSVLDEGYEILETRPGAALQGTRYEPLYPAALDKPAHFIVCDSYVSMEDGTGIVHIAPAFGDDDARVGRANDLPHLQRVDPQGLMTADTPWAGRFVKDADPLIIQDLRARGLLLRVMPYTHDYPFCWRCDTPLLYYARPAWFIRMTAVRDTLMASNRSVNWLPENIKEGRMGDFIENVVDWGLSRERYWGTPLPVWTCACGHIHVVGSIAELRAMGRDVPDDLELHRPYIDAVTLTCPACGGEMRRVKEVIDCWYDSGSMPFAQWHYPFENKEIFEARFPAQFISEAIDQTRGWFYTLLAIGTLLFDRAPFENCIVMGHVQDKDGVKMSKHKGNVIAPKDVLEKHGADAVRWYFYAGGAPWLPSRFSGDMVGEVQRKFMGTLWNTYAFFVLYANIDGFNPAQSSVDDSELTLMDRWLLSRLNSLIAAVDAHLEKYHVMEGARAIAAFVDELSNWYVRRGRERFWSKGMAEGKRAAFHSLYTTLETLARLLAPFTPFLSESLYQNLVASVRPDAPESVHLTDFPTADLSRVDPALEADMNALLRAVQLGRACRNLAGLKVRQPVPALYVRAPALPDDLCALLRDELNAKEVRFVDDARAFTAYKLKPQMRTLGPRYGKALGAIGKALAEMDGSAAVDAFDRGETLTFQAGGVDVELTKDDVLMETAPKSGFISEQDGALTVVLDTNLTPALIEEGFAREAVSKIQTMRREAGFEVTDRIHIAFQAGERLTAILTARQDMILAGTLGLSLTSTLTAPETATQKDWDINGEPAAIALWRDSACS